MKSLIKLGLKVRDAARREEGATAVEYGLIIGLIAVVIIVAVTLLGDTLAGLFGQVTDELPTISPTP